MADLRRYVIETDPSAVQQSATTAAFESAGRPYELIHFARRGAPAVLISPGSSGTGQVFAELGYRIWGHGYSVFIMPKHGPYVLSELVQRHDDALRRIAALGHERIGLFAEGLGGYAAFYLALAHGPMHSLVCQNAPAIVTEDAYQRAIYGGREGQRRRRLVPFARLLAKLSKRITLPVSSYLDFRKMIDPQLPSRAIEERIVAAYQEDPDFDRRYPLSAILSLLDTPPPAPLEALAVPTMFIVPTRGIIPDYEKDLFARLPAIDKRLVEVDGSVFWMVSHPSEAADLICSWFARTLRAPTVAQA